MYVCHCRGVTDRTVRAAIDSGAVTIEALALQCSAGAHCGGCLPALEELLVRHDRERRHSGAPTAACA
jgi:bacterioferritin-associated ferredoxin